MTRQAWLLVVLVPCSIALADRTPFDGLRWTEETRTWLARAMVAEAGWEAERDHIAIAYVLWRQWRSKAKTAPDVRLINIIRGYCAGLEPGRRELTDRQRWLRSLMPDMREPDGWPADKARWSMHRRLWAAALKRADQWYHGKFRDPCRGLAWHWGGEMDPRRGKMYRVDCGDTLNTFYGIGQGGDTNNDGETEENAYATQGRRRDDRADKRPSVSRAKQRGDRVGLVN